MLRHERIALCASGGKDSLACVHLLRDFWDRITVYTADTGDTLPEMQASVAAIEAMVPHFVRVQTDVAGWIAEHGLPTDLLPHSAHAIGHAMGEPRTRLASRWDCCFANRMGPLLARIRADGCTMMVTGVRRGDMPSMPYHDGDVVEGLEICAPVETWSADDVLAYLTACGADLPPVYQHLAHAPDCARCSAHWGERRGAYLKRFHPDVFQDYQDRLTAIAREIAPVLLDFQHELVG